MPPSTTPVPTEVGLSNFHRPTHTIAALRGDIDIAIVPVLCERLLGIFRAGMRLLILGLSGVSSCEVAGPAGRAEYLDRVLGPWRGRA
ncbi:MAG: hypothetical protein QOE54_5487 [Streptosporangiaceae bacterium]|nr:hypothetical protein [Streptosporangiaceae bacterium]